MLAAAEQGGDALAGDPVELAVPRRTGALPRGALPSRCPALEVFLSGDVLRIAVADGSDLRPVVREVRTENPPGCGLRLVQAIADRRGTDEHPGGKRFWFALRPPGAGFAAGGPRGGSR